MVSLKKELGIKKVLKYPLTLIPLSMCHVDDTICKTDKLVLLKMLEKQVESKEPEVADFIVYDGFFMLHLMKDIPIIFGNISPKFLTTLCNTTAFKIVVTFDRYICPSLKDTEHKLRGLEQPTYDIDGPYQMR